MQKICKICGKPIKGDVLKHFEEKHFSIYAANRDKIAAHPGAFVVDEDGVDAEQAVESIKAASAKKKKKERHFDKKRMKEAITVLDRFREEQTYRADEEFKCYTCLQKHKHGKILYGDTQNLHLCYECYRYAKEHVKSKRGNKHVFINTPM